MKPEIRTIDTLQFGLRRAGAAYTVQGDRMAIVESGTASAATAIQASLDGETPHFILLTHIHLDHAGGAGHLARAFPEALVVVHERGSRHLEDPSRLIAGVRSASPRLFELYGEPLPIPSSQLLSVRGGEILDLGSGVALEVVASPGHAPHHVCFFEHNTRTLFTGDAVGNWSNPVDIPLTVPPRFDLELGLQSLANLRALHPNRLAFTHFGIADQALMHLDRYECELIEWFKRIQSLSLTMGPDELMNHILKDKKYASLTETERDMVTMCIHGAILSLKSGSASV